VPNYYILKLQTKIANNAIHISKKKQQSSDHLWMAICLTKRHSHDSALRSDILTIRLGWLAARSKSMEASADNGGKQACRCPSPSPLPPPYPLPLPCPHPTPPSTVAASSHRSHMFTHALHPAGGPLNRPDPNPLLTISLIGVPHSYLGSHRPSAEQSPLPDPQLPNANTSAARAD
jgi:hypothetical protein